MSKSCCAPAFLIFMLVCSSVFAQTPGQQASGRPAAGSAATQSLGSEDPAAAMAAARELLAAGRVQEAITRLNTVLARYPANRDATLVKTSALLGQQRFEDALSTYDAYTAALRKPDVGVLALIARANLSRLARQRPGDPALVSASLERLAREGDAEALEALRRRAASSSATPQETQELLVSLARLGDKDAAVRLGELLASAPSANDRARMIRVLQDAGARNQAPSIAAFLSDPDPQVRAAAALAVGALQFSKALPRLEALFEDDVPVVRMFAAVALKRLGQPTADAYLAELLKNEIPEVRLIAAEAYQTAKTTQWVNFIRELLTDRNELSRLRAAELLACCDQAAARSVLLPALDSPNPAFRTEAARILEAKNLADAKIARLLLGDPVDAIRLHGAGAALLLARASSR